MICDVKTVHAALLKHGFEIKDMPIPSRRTEISRAAYSFQNRLGKENRRVTEKANDNANFVVYGILDREQEEADSVKFTQHTTITLDKATDAVKVEGSLADEVTNTINTYAGKYTDDDIRYFLRRVVKMCFGVAKRPTGGIYFVPEGSVSVIKSAQILLQELNGNAKLYVEGIINGERERQNVWEAVEEDIDTRLDETIAAVERIERRTNAIRDQEAKLDEVKKLMDFYTELLGEEAKYQTISEKYEKAVKTVADKMSVLQKGTMAPVPARKAAMPPPKAATGVQFSNEWVKTAYEILKENSGAMNYRELTSKAIAKGLQAEVQNPSDAMYNRIKNSIVKGEGLFKKVGAGLFKLA